MLSLPVMQLTPWFHCCRHCWTSMVPVSMAFAPRLDGNCGNISLGDIRYMPTQWVLALFLGFLNFWPDAPKFRSLEGGGGIIFGICEKSLFQKCTG